MARLARLVLPGYPHHVVQRGNNRQAIFVDDSDRVHYLELLTEASWSHGVSTHAFVLMPNHVHLLVTPASEVGLGLLMQAVGRAYVHWFNKRHGRTGTLFEGRFKSSVIESDRYALACMRYIETNPLRAGLVANPADFRWSSYSHNTGSKKFAFVSEHSLYWSLGNTPFERQAAYRRMFESPLSDAEVAPIRDSIQGGWAVGAFQGDEPSVKVGRRANQLARGRPKKKIND